MAYTVTTTAGTVIATVADGTVNTTATSITLIGKNYAGYGIFLNENYIQHLENFSNTTPPNAPLTGQLWYDNVNDVLKVYNSVNNIWKPISSSISQSTAPSAAISVTGDIWWDTTNAQLKVWSGSAWITIGPSYTSTAGTSGAVVETILDTSSGSHVVVKFYISNSAIAILSKDSTFTTQTAISGFSTLIPGLNLISQATLTGAQVVALGTRTSAVMTNNEEFSAQFLKLAAHTGEAFWPMPLPIELRASLDSPIADMANVGERMGNMLVAGLFLKEFIADDLPWLHLDIAGPAYNEGQPHGYTPVGGTGIALRTLVALAELSE
jgi:hypothetical protein